MIGGAAAVIAIAGFVAIDIATYFIEPPTLSHRLGYLSQLPILGIVAGAYSLQWGRNLWTASYSPAEDRTLLSLVNAFVWPWHRWR